MRGASGTPRRLRIRVLATAVIVFTISLAVAVFLAYELLLQDGRRDADVVLAREQERFERSMTELLADAFEGSPDASSETALREAVRRYLQLNPSTDSYWTIVTFEDGRRLAAANGPPELEPLFHGIDGQALPEGELGEREALPSSAGDVRTVSVPVNIDGEQVATFQVIAPLEPVRDEAIEAGLLIAAAAGLALLVGGTLLGITLWRSLAPLGSLADAARSTGLEALETRVDVPDADDEVSVLAREFNTMLERIAAATEQQREFMASVGHELRTPITIARGHLELLQTTPRDDAAYTETVAILDDELRRMSRLVDDLMAIARADMDDFIQRRQIELVAWFEDLELRLAGTPAGRSVTIVPPPPVLLEADPDRLAQAVLNVVINAHVHTPEGTAVRLEAGAGPDGVTVSVSDDGPGIPEGIRDRIFQPFSRAGDAPGSTGLGLAVVHAVVSAHGGEVQVESGPAGTRFDLRLPWAGQGRPEDPEMARSQGAGGSADVPATPTQVEG